LIGIKIFLDIVGGILIFKIFSFISIFLFLSSCITDNGRIVINRIKTNQSTNITVSNIKIVHHQIIVTGTNLNTVNNLHIKEGASSTALQIESQNNTSLVANSISNITLAAGKVFDFVLTNANASTTFAINFSLCDSQLGGKTIDCFVAPNDKEVLAYDGGSGKWKPRAMNGLSYKGVWDASGAAPAAVTPGDYYIVSAPGSGYSVGDWTVYRGSGVFDRINNSTTITSVFGRTNAVVGVKGDYDLNDLGDIDLTSTPPAPDDVLTFVGGQWVPRPVVSGGPPSNSVTSADIVDGTIINADINSAAAIAYSKLNVPALAIPLTALNATGTKDGTKYLKGDNTWAVLQDDIQAIALSTYTIGTNALVTASDSVSSAVGKLQKQISDLAISAVGGDVSGNLPTLTVTKIRGTSVSATAPTTGHFFKYNGANWLGSMVTVGDLKSSALGNLFPGTGCAANQTLYYSVVGDAFTCVDIGSLDGAKITTGTIDAARLPAAASYWSAATGGINYGVGNVGIGMATPFGKLDVFGGQIAFRNNGNIGVRNFSYGGNSTFESYAAEGTMASPTKIIGADRLLSRFEAYGQGDTAPKPAASIAMISDGAFSDTSSPGSLLFETTPSGTTTSVARMRITSDGNVGIGTLIPDSKLTIVDTMNVPASPLISSIVPFKISDGTNGLLLDSNQIESVGGSLYINQRATDGTGKNIIMGVGGGSVGIGTNFPRGPLDVVKSATAPWQGQFNFQVSSSQSGGGTTSANAAVLGLLRSRNTDASPQAVELADALGTIAFGGYNGTAMYHGATIVSQATENWGASASGSNLIFSTTSNGVLNNVTERMRIAPNGNVGIGTINPAAKLDVAGSVKFGDGFSGNQNVTVLGASAGTAIVDIGSNGAGVDLRNVDTTNNNFTHIAFRSSGGFPSAKIVGINIDHTSTAVEGALSFVTSANSILTERMRILGNGHVGIGTPTPAEALDVAGKVQATAFLNTSDRRLKKNIVDIDNSLEKILSLRGVEFDWKKSGEHEIGLIAQEVEEVEPSLVATSSITGLKSVKYSNIVALLIEAMKSEHSKIENNKKLYMVMKNGLEEINQRVNSVEREMASLREENKKLREDIEAIKKALK
jgi:hypothetical protein